MRPILAIDRHLLVAVSGGLTSPLRARPAQKEPVPLTLPGTAPAANLGAAPAATAKPAADPLAAMISQLVSQPR